jgi:hypothetical protein
LRLLYPLSATNRFGSRRLCPPLRRTSPCSSRFSATVMSCCCPGVSKNVNNLPLPSARTWIFVVNPPRLRPKASASGVLFLPLQHVDGHAQSYHLQIEPPNPTALADRLATEVRIKLAATPPSFSNVENDCTPSSISRNALASLARVIRCAISTRYHLAGCGVRGKDVLSTVSAVVIVVRSFPIVRLIVRLYRPCSPL